MAAALLRKILAAPHQKVENFAALLGPRNFDPPQRRARRSLNRSLNAST